MLLSENQQRASQERNGIIHRWKISSVKTIELQYVLPEGAIACSASLDLANVLTDVNEANYMTKEEIIQSVIDFRDSAMQLLEAEIREGGKLKIDSASRRRIIDSIRAAQHDAYHELRTEFKEELASDASDSELLETVDRARILPELILSNSNIDTIDTKSRVNLENVRTALDKLEEQHRILTELDEEYEQIFKEYDGIDTPRYITEQVISDLTEFLNPSEQRPIFLDEELEQYGGDIVAVVRGSVEDRLDTSARPNEILGAYDRLFAEIDPRRLYSVVAKSEKSQLKSTDPLKSAVSELQQIQFDGTV